MAERSKAPDSSSGGENRVGSNPTAVILYTKTSSRSAGKFAAEKAPSEGEDGDGCSVEELLQFRRILLDQAAVAEQNAAMWTQLLSFVSGEI